MLFFFHKKTKNHPKLSAIILFSFSFFFCLNWVLLPLANHLFFFRYSFYLFLGLLLHSIMAQTATCFLGPQKCSTQYAQDGYVFSASCQPSRKFCFINDKLCADCIVSGTTCYSTSVECTNNYYPSQTGSPTGSCIVSGQSPGSCQYLMQSDVSKCTAIFTGRLITCEAHHLSK